MLNRLLATILAPLAGALLLALPAAAQTQTTPARAAIVVDMTSGAVLLEKNADQPLPPASMSKLMTLEVVFDALKQGRLALEDEFRVSAQAASMGGSKMFIREGALVSVADLLRGVIVQSGNDAAVALAEAISGSEEAFAQLMNRRAAEIGLTDSYLTNATGLPDEKHRMSVRDLARLAEHLIREYPAYYPMFAETEFTWADITQQNRNPLLDAGLGADGLKTGHTVEAGYGLAASARRGERRVILVVAGLESEAQRRQEAERLINWAFRAFDTVTLVRAGEPVAEARTWLGAEPRVALAPARDLVVTVPYNRLEEAELKAHFREPVEAPVAQGAELGRLEAVLPDVAPVSVPLVAAHSVEEGGIRARLEAAGELLLRRLRAAVGG